MLNWETPRHAVRCTHCSSMNTNLVLEFLSLERYSCGACGRAFETSSHRVPDPTAVPTLPVLAAAPATVRVGRDGAPAPRVGARTTAPAVCCPTCQTDHVFRARKEAALERWLCAGCGQQFHVPVSIPA